MHVLIGTNRRPHLFKHQIQGPNKAQFETQIKVNHCYNTDHIYNENQQALQKLTDAN